MDLVYWFAYGSNGEYCVVFAPRERAEYVAQIYTALRESSTWGEFRRKLPKGEWERYIEVVYEPVPEKDWSFKPDDVPGHADGDYPPWLAQEQLRWFPQELISKYDGEIGTSVLNGPSLNLPAENADQIADALRAMGYSVDETNLVLE